MDSRQSLITKEFKKISNPHLKSKPKATIKTQDMHRIKKVQDNYRIKIEEVFPFFKQLPRKTKKENSHQKRNQ